MRLKELEQKYYELRDFTAKLEGAVNILMQWLAINKHLMDQVQLQKPEAPKEEKKD